MVACAGSPLPAWYFAGSAGCCGVSVSCCSIWSDLRRWCFRTWFMRWTTTLSLWVAGDVIPKVSRLRLVQCWRLPEVLQSSQPCPFPPAAHWVETNASILSWGCLSSSWLQGGVSLWWICSHSWGTLASCCFVSVVPVACWLHPHWPR